MEPKEAPVAETPAYSDGLSSVSSSRSGSRVSLPVGAVSLAGIAAVTSGWLTGRIEGLDWGDKHIPGWVFALTSIWAICYPTDVMALVSRLPIPFVRKEK